MIVTMYLLQTNKRAKGNSIIWYTKQLKEEAKIQVFFQSNFQQFTSSFKKCGAHKEITLNQMPMKGKMGVSLDIMFK